MMPSLLKSPAINIAAAIVGGVMLGWGIGRFAHQPAMVPGVFAVFGLILLWWALSDRRKGEPGAPESEVGGGHTIE
jgi:hypothetical protein